MTTAETNERASEEVNDNPPIESHQK
ncbi:hypothetical protein CCACVL1_05049 [Corchorus capsularis]|uniref:Uncharacterized protein n=1 Tax=Corchorus capsularis TaxID=210143 RepID=A0A1R3JN27_COCAP|nr:hypothetical protein CCACVL1_05049 [Corchorus capsularis]